jgi:hypothetical protein
MDYGPLAMDHFTMRWERETRPQRRGAKIGFMSGF